jgi:hypothetical protein
LLDAAFRDKRDEAHADCIRDSLYQIGPVVPSLWPFEVANSLVIGERRGRRTVAKATARIALLRNHPFASMTGPSHI